MHACMSQYVTYMVMSQFMRCVSLYAIYMLVCDIFASVCDILNAFLLMSQRVMYMSQ